ncbi:MAG: DUF4357 domain-containing protein [Fibrobacter sp.]|nr:DUF4357 domain-containing protein [Fibrobacter sp.]
MDGKNLLFHFAKGGDVVAKVKRVGSQNASVSADGTLRNDIVCDSPSMAAALVAGGQRNGLTFWKNKDKKELKGM